MNKLVIDNKKYVVIEEKEFEQLQENAARKTLPIKKLSLSQGKKHAYKLIDKWSKVK
jgi:hypothetical protein